MKSLINLIIIVFLSITCRAQNPAGSAADQAALIKTTAAIRDGFARGDVDAVVALHHPNVVKYFGGNNVVTGREGLRKSLTQMFSSKMEFIQNDIESTIFNGNTVIQTVIFTIKITPKNGGPSTMAHGRSMVVYVRYKDSPYGWVSLREMAQEGPPEKNP